MYMVSAPAVVGRISRERSFQSVCETIRSGVRAVVVRGVEILE
jgi:hypothetical protein